MGLRLMHVQPEVQGIKYLRETALIDVILELKINYFSFFTWKDFLEIHIASQIKFLRS